MNQKVDEFLINASKWQVELTQLRKVVLDCHLNEELKWGVPCYTYNKSNIVLIHAFKEYCAILFFKGALLKDVNDILIEQTKNVQASRQIRFTNIDEIVKLEAVLKTYIKEAIEIEKSGLKIDFKKTTEYIIPEEFQIELNKNTLLKSSFEKLTPGRQRAYILYFTAPKQSKTRQSRIEKYIETIMNGKGLND